MTFWSGRLVAGYSWGAVSVLFTFLVLFLSRDSGTVSGAWFCFFFPGAMVGRCTGGDRGGLARLYDAGTSESTRNRKNNRNEEAQHRGVGKERLGTHARNTLVKR